MPKSDSINDSASENLLKNKESWDGGKFLWFTFSFWLRSCQIGLLYESFIVDPWGEPEKQINMTPLPERIRNIPLKTTTTKDIHDSNTPVSLLDKLDSRASVDSDDKQDEKHDISW